MPATISPKPVRELISRSAERCRAAVKLGAELAALAARSREAINRSRHVLKRVDDLEAQARTGLAGSGATRKIIR
jgi:hypothetical protein